MLTSAYTPLESKNLFKQLSNVDVVLAIDESVQLEFVLLGREIYEMTNNETTLTILRVAIHGRTDLENLCNLVRAANGNCECDPSSLSIAFLKKSRNKLRQFPVPGAASVSSS